jgi:indolepyruvate ferredoxin oxidoreductase, alpha subunit
MTAKKTVMSGNEAIARGAWEAGVTVACAYPGTPSTEILESLTGYSEIDAQWSPNEKVALEFGFGSSLGGARTMVSMKHVGVNVAMDPLMTISYAGVNGGLVLVSADDPSMFSSQNEQDNRNIARFARMVLLEPATSQEAKEMTRLAFDLSEKFDIPVMLRGTTRLCHGRGIVELDERREVPLRPYVKDYKKYMMLPSVCRVRRVDLENRLEQLAGYSETFAYNRIIKGSPDMGIICCGIASMHAREAVPDASFLVLGLINPLPRKLIKEFAESVKKLYVVEELDPILETEIKAMGIEVIGKERIPRYGELRPELVAAALKEDYTLLEHTQEITPPSRPPLFCPGCAHRPVFDALRKLKATVAGDIGCYSLGAYQPLSSMDMNLCMGASIGVAHGMEKARKAANKSRGRLVGIIGDSTFLHSGITPLLDVIYNRGTVCTVLLDNSTTAMTGHQDHPGTGRTARGHDAPCVDYEKLANALGLERVVTVNPLQVKILHRVLKEEIDCAEPSLVIVKAPCVLHQRKTPSHFVMVDSQTCSGCGECFNLGCPAIAKDDDGKAFVTKAQCAGCSVCVQVCEENAMRLMDRKDVAN